MTIKVENLNKQFNNILAVKNINFKINPGSIVGLLGPNGCGKTTTIGMMLGLIKPTSGNVFINDKNIDSEKNRTNLLEKMNFISPYVELPKKLKVQDENLRIDFELEPTTINLEQVSVSAERMRFENRVDVSRVNLSNKDIRRAPAFVEADVFRTLQLLPSVSASNDFNASLIVRGGSPDENLVLLDGTEIYNQYHIGGIFSTFN